MYSESCYLHTPIKHVKMYYDDERKHSKILFPRIRVLFLCEKMPLGITLEACTQIYPSYGFANSCYSILILCRILIRYPLDLPILRPYVRSVYAGIIRQDVFFVVLVGRDLISHEMVFSIMVIMR